MKSTSKKSSKTWLVILGIIALLAGGWYLVCAYKYGTDFMAHKEKVAMITGTVAYRERMALPKNSTVEVNLWNTPRNGNAKVVGNSIVVTQGENVPIPFSIKYNPSRLERHSTYSLSATITVNGSVKWMTHDAVPVLGKDAPTSDITIMVQSASETSSSSSPKTNTSSKPVATSTPTSTSLSGTYRLTMFNTTKMDSSENYTITFGSKNKFSAKFCNAMSGTYKTKGTTVSSEMLSTLMYCTEPAHLGTIEGAFNKAMGQGVTYSFKDGSLILKAQNTDTFVFEKAM